MTSAPLGVPEIFMPKVYTLPFFAMLVGVALASDAAPPLMVNEKSVFSKSPLPLLALNTASDIVTAMVALSAATATLDTVGGSLSFKLAVLLF